jgi:outer membrane protein assembly factor BamB
LVVLALPVAAAADGPAGYRVDPAHTGAAQGTTFAPPLGKKWVRRDLGESVSFPVLAEGRVFLSAGSTVYALDRATGATIWSRAMRTRGVAYDNGRIFAVDANGNMQALSAATGNVLWTARLPGASSDVSPPNAYGEFVYASSDSTVFGVRQDTGIVIWSSGGPTDSGSIPAGDGDKVYVSGDCGQATALERRTGVEVWNHDSNCTRGNASGTAVYGGRVFARGVVLDALTGLLQDSYAATGGPALADDTGYFTNGKELFARANDSGVTRWRYADKSTLEAQPLVAGAHVYTVNDDGMLIGVVRATGQKVWESDLKTGFGSSDRGFGGVGAAGDNLVVSAGSRVVGYGSGADTPGVDDPDKPPSNSRTLEVRVSKTKIAYGRTVTLSGSLDNNGGGSDVEILADRFPFDGYQPLTTVKTDTYGDFKLDVKPDRNTRYRAVYNGTFPAAQSAELTVFSDFALGFRILARSRRSVLIRMSAAGPPEAKLRGAKMFVYHFRARARVANRIGVVRLRGKGTKVKGKAVMRTPVLKRSDLFFTCRREVADDGFGEPDPRLAECGRRRVR